MANVQTSKFKKNFSKVTEGDWIQFERKGHVYQGEVKMIREATVMVAVDPKAFPGDLGFENNITVVNHGNYNIIKNK